MPRLRHPVPTTNPVDFHVYYAAALLVRTGHAADLYTGADTGADPQKVAAGANTPILRAAQSQGLPFVGLYLYPPLLANLLVPLTAVNLKTATQIWFAFDALLLLFTALLLIRLLRFPLFSGRAGLVVLMSLCFTPALQALVDGQITILLLFLWTAGLVLYQEDHVPASATVFALATAIKLTPAIVLLPFLLWRKWRFVGGYLIALLCFAGICLFFDTPHTFAVYFTRVLPAMSRSIPYYTNLSLAAAMERLLSLLVTGAVTPYPEALPAFTVLAGRIVSVMVLLTLVTLIARVGKHANRRNQILVLGLLSLMAPILSPVSWFHAYATALIAFVLLWRECFEGPVGTPYLLSLTAITLLLGSAVSENLMSRFVYSGRHAFFTCCLHFGQLLGASMLVSYRLWKIGTGKALGSAVPDSSLTSGALPLQA